MSPTRSARLLLPLISALSGCASVTTYPSLTRRPIEQAAEGAPPVEAAAALDPAVMAQATAFVTQAQRGDGAFEAAVRVACPAVARGAGAGQGSEAWVAAQQALSAVETARQESSDALDGVEALVLEQSRLAGEQPRPVDLAPLLAAAADVAARDAAQAARLDALRAGRCQG